MLLLSLEFRPIHCGKTSSILCRPFRLATAIQLFMQSTSVSNKTPSMSNTTAFMRPSCLSMSSSSCTPHHRAVPRPAPVPPGLSAVPYPMPAPPDLSAKPFDPCVNTVRPFGLPCGRKILPDPVLLLQNLTHPAPAHLLQILELLQKMNAIVQHQHIHPRLSLPFFHE